MSVSLWSNLKAQLDELALLQSMYSENECVVNNLQALIDIQDFVKGEVLDAPKNHLDLTLIFKCDEQDVSVALNFPFDYPSEKSGVGLPSIFVRSSLFSQRQHQAEINDALRTYLLELADDNSGVSPVMECIAWVQEKLPLLVSEQQKRTEREQRRKQKEMRTMDAARGIVRKVSGDRSHEGLVRLWIHSHHIYNPQKRKAIIDAARANELSGFSLPGKPGLVCLEGDEESCDSAWNEIRVLKWKKISLRRKDTSVNDRAFETFEEIGFASNPTSHHMDFGGFRAYLQQHGCGELFKELVGME